MPKTADNPDIKYQPKVQGFAYTTNPQPQIPVNLNSGTSNPPPLQAIEDKSNILFTLLAEIFGLVLLFFIFLAVLNYFNIISLRTISPALFGKLPIQEVTQIEQEVKPSRAPNGEFIISGTLYGYKNDLIQIEINNKIITYKFTNKSSVQVSLPGENIASDSSDLQVDSFFTLYNLEKKENLGRVVQIYYLVNSNGENIIDKIILQE